MNEYLRAFQSVNESVDLLLADEHNSLEITQSATRLQKSVEPCIAELRQSAERLKGLVQVSLDELNHAEDVWNSKPRITDAPTHQIWEQLGELSGIAFRIRYLGSQCKDEAIKQAKTTWEKKTESLTNKWFMNPKKEIKNSLGFGEKDGLIKELRLEVGGQKQEMYRFFIESQKLINQELETISLDCIKQIITLFDQHLEAYWNDEMNLVINNIKSKVGEQPENWLSESLYTDFDSQMKNLTQNAFMINWENFCKFKNQITSRIESNISLLFENRLQIAIQTVEKAISFYNNFLECQQRYQQEAPEQRQSEKAWIDQQRQQLQLVQNGIEVILNPFAQQ